MSVLNRFKNSKGVKFQVGYGENAEFITITNKKLIPIAKGLKSIFTTKLDIQGKKDLVERNTIKFQNYLDRNGKGQNLNLQEKVIVHFIEVLTEAIKRDEDMQYGTMEA